MNYMLQFRTDRVPVLATRVHLSRYGALSKKCQDVTNGMPYITNEVIT